jgi:PDZ domain-containing protein
VSEPSRHPPRVWILAVIIVVMLLAGGYGSIADGAKGYYAFAPGTAPRLTDSAQCRQSGTAAQLLLPDGTPCARISVPAGRGHPIAGSLYMVDVLVGPATPGEYILSKLGLLHRFDDGIQLVPASAVLGTTPAGQLPCQDAQQMEGSTSAAAVVALRHLGYQVKENDLGAQLYQVSPGSPAAAAGLQCNDVVTAINTLPVHTANDLVKGVHAAKPGQTVRLTLQRIGSGGKPHTVTLSAKVSATPALPGQAPRPGQAFLGVVSVTRTTYSFPFNVTIDVGGIGGPSAGLALTLGILDLLSNGDLTGGHRVAATGTIELDGTVGDVGGVAQKTVAVRKAGAQVFLVPPQEFKTAQSEAGSMKVYAVTTLQQALADLQSLGGRIPAALAAQNGGRVSP